MVMVCYGCLLFQFFYAKIIKDLSLVSQAVNMWSHPLCWDPEIHPDAPSTPQLLRYVARCRSDLALYGSNFSEEGDIDEWLEFALHEARESS